MSSPTDNSSLPVMPSGINFEKVDMRKINQILSTGSVNSLTPSERAYYDLMLMVRGFRMRMRSASGRIITKAGIIRLLKEQFHVSDWMARQIYADAINFFYGTDEITPKAWANLYAEKMEKWADQCFLMGDTKTATRLLTQAAKLRGADKAGEHEGDGSDEMRAPSTIIYTNKASDMGLPDPDAKEVETIIGSLPQIPEIVRDSIMEDAGLKKMNLQKRLFNVKQEFSPDEG